MCTNIETIRMIFNQGKFKNRNVRVYPTPRLHKKILQLFVKFCFMFFLYDVLPVTYEINKRKQICFLYFDNIFFSFLKQN